ncbi:glutamate receptor ionotropic, kainate 2-like [Onthophagus taurus]|uniref:glutamate receptor ionotropic, kainate 2-like n=1 Tax=Onthophagus taurus TaxID=166361 RepID=UPI0039BE7561
MLFLVFFYTILHSLNVSFAQYNIGLIDEVDYDVRSAFDIASQSKLLIPHKEALFSTDPYRALQIACSLLDSKVIGILVTSNRENTDPVQSICDLKEIPMLEVRWNDRLSRGGTSINIYPHPPSLSKAYVDIIKFWKWDEFTILYEDNEGLSRMSEILKMGHIYNIMVKQLIAEEGSNYRASLKEVWKSDHINFVLDCRIDNLETILEQAQQIGLITKTYSFIITNLDFHTIDLEPFKYSEAKITGVRMLNPESEKLIRFAEDVAEKKHETYRSNQQEAENVLAVDKLRLETALVADAVTFFGSAALEIDNSTTFYQPNAFCSNSYTWKMGMTIYNYMKTLTVDGLTGTIKLDNEGFRSDFNLDLIELAEEGVFTVATWNMTDGIQKKLSPIDKVINGEYSLQNRSFIVITTLTYPYGMLKESQESLKGNDRFEGFAIDLIRELGKLEGFNYTFIIREDKANGVKDEHGKWSGMIGDLITEKADLAITDLTITSEREEAVDFTSPFMNLGISILYRKPSKAPPNFFSFAAPFAIEVWLTLAGAYFIVSISLFVMGRLCPSEWTNPYPCIDSPEFLINQFSLRNSFWFAIGSLLQQGTEIAPIAYATRMVAGIWWFFTLIMVSSYTANLAAFLATENPDIPFNNVYELNERAARLGIKFGAKKNGATLNFFRDATSKEFQQIYHYMHSNEDDVMMKENSDGVDRAERELYAFFMESSSIEYEVQRRCNLTQIGGLLDEKGYGIAMRKNSIYRHALSTAVLKLQETGKIQDLKRKWWEERRGGGQCMGDGDREDAKPLNLKNVGGVFWVTVGGTLAAVVLVFLEMILHVMKVSIQHKVSFVQLLKEEMKFYMQFKGLVKPVTTRKGSKSPEESEKTNEHERIEQPTYGFLPAITKGSPID